MTSGSNVFAFFRVFVVAIVFFFPTFLIMNKIFVLMAGLLIVGACTTTQQLQQQCAQISQTFGQEVQCLQNMVSENGLLASDSYAQEYVVTGRVLAQRVAKGEISEDEARMLFARKYNQLQLEQQRLNTLSAAEWRALEPRYQDCTVHGNRVQCYGY